MSSCSFHSPTDSSEKMSILKSLSNHLHINLSHSTIEMRLFRFFFFLDNPEENPNLCKSLFCNYIHPFRKTSSLPPPHHHQLIPSALEIILTTTYFAEIKDKNFRAKVSRFNCLVFSLLLFLVWRPHPIVFKVSSWIYVQGSLLVVSGDYMGCQTLNLGGLPACKANAQPSLLSLSCPDLNPTASLTSNDLGPVTEPLCALVSVFVKEILIILNSSGYRDNSRS